jgi:hypothetical protein
MIKTTELRRGNLVGFKPQDNTIPCPVEIIEQHCAVVKYHNAVLRLFEEDMHPISLTEELFQKFGFEKAPLHEWVHRLHIIYANMKRGFFAPPYQNQILYIHQFQNWWFSVTGEELAIKK